MKIKNLVHTLRKNGIRTGVMHYRYISEDVNTEPHLTLVTKKNKHTFADILAKGGETEVNLTFPDGSDYTETAYCSIKDGYVKAFGINLAVERIFEKRKAEGKTVELNNVTLV